MQYPSLKKHFDIINKICFDNKLKLCTLRYRTLKGIGGYFYCELNKVTKKINKNFRPTIVVKKNIKKSDIIGVLLHEMLHYYDLFLMTDYATKKQLKNIHTKKFCIKNQLLAKKLLKNLKLKSIYCVTYKNGDAIGKTLIKK